MFFPRELLTRRVAVDHQRLQDGGTNVLPFGFPRGTNPIGGPANDHSRSDRVGALQPGARRLLDLAGSRGAADAGAHRRGAGLVAERRRRDLVAAQRRRGSASRRSWGCDARGSSRSSRSSPNAASPSSRARTAAPSVGRSTSGSWCGHGRASSARRSRSRRRPPARPPRSLRTAAEQTVANVIDVTASGDGLSLPVVDRPGGACGVRSRARAGAARAVSVPRWPPRPRRLHDAALRRELGVLPARRSGRVKLPTCSAGTPRAPAELAVAPCSVPQAQSP